MPTDMLGNELKVGTRVAYAHRAGCRCRLEIRTITALGDRGVYMNHSHVIATNTHNMLVVPDNYPIEVR